MRGVSRRRCDDACGGARPPVREGLIAQQEPRRTARRAQVDAIVKFALADRRQPSLLRDHSEAAQFEAFAGSVAGVFDTSTHSPSKPIAEAFIANFIVSRSNAR